MTILIIIALLVVLLAGWVMSTQRRLVVMDENINNAMSQIGVQLSSRFDALTALLDLAKGYAKCMDAVDSYEKMVRTSRLIYNDSVTKLNREIRMFPVSLIAGMLGFRQRDYLEAREDKADMPSMK